MSLRSKFTGIALSLALLAGAGGAFATQQAEFDRIETEMEQIRDLQFQESLDISVQSRDELREWLLELIENEYPAEEQERDERVMVLFGFIEPGTDLGQLQIDLLGEQVAGYYDPETKAMVVVSTGTAEGLSASDEVTFAHEAVHALQDQNFDLMELQDVAVGGADDQYLAISALIEGDASLGQVLYIVEYPRLLLGLQADLADLDTSVLDDASPYISGTLLFPYEQGLTFVTELHDQGGWDLVNQAWENPPQSTEQILHPEKYLAGEAPIPITVNDPLPVLGDEWEVIEINTMGEFVTRLFLDTGEVRPETAVSAAEGWGGDQFVVMGDETDTALVWSTEWDSEEDAQEFFDVLVVHETKRFNAQNSVSGQTVTFEGKDATGQDIAGEIRIEGAAVTYVLAPDAETVGALFDNQMSEGEPAREPQVSPVASPAS